jgi:hypothetical protein
MMKILGCQGQRTIKNSRNYTKSVAPERMSPQVTWDRHHSQWQRSHNVARKWEGSLHQWIYGENASLSFWNVSRSDVMYFCHNGLSSPSPCLFRTWDQRGRRVLLHYTRLWSSSRRFPKFYWNRGNVDLDELRKWVSRIAGTARWECKVFQYYHVTLGSLRSSPAVRCTFRDFVFIGRRRGVQSRSTLTWLSSIGPFHVQGPDRTIVIKPLSLFKPKELCVSTDHPGRKIVSQPHALNQ